MNPYIIDLGFFQVRYYGLMYAISLYIGLIILAREIKRKKINIADDKVQSMGFVIFFLALLGARIYYVIFNLGYYFGPGVPWYEFLAIWHGGLAIHGGIIGGILPVYYYSRKYNVPFLALTDMIVLGVILGQSLGRFGNFMNGDAHGLPTDLPWGVVFKYGPAAAEFPGIPLHPVMIYELILNFLAFLFLWNLRKKDIKNGLLTSLYLILYSLIRSFVTIFRADDLYLVLHNSSGNHWFVPDSLDFSWGIKAPHAISLILILLALFLIVKYKLFEKRSGQKA